MQENSLFSNLALSIVLRNRVAEDYTTMPSMEEKNLKSKERRSIQDSLDNHFCHLGRQCMNLQTQWGFHAHEASESHPWKHELIYDLCFYQFQQTMSCSFYKSELHKKLLSSSWCWHKSCYFALGGWWWQLQGYSLCFLLLAGCCCSIIYHSLSKRTSLISQVNRDFSIT